ncbi:MAG: tetratricopeptide repeat protein [Bacteroidales bacterium]|jgi:serine phosphatase RsbU (regulator of sigma subunit)|nr:tetratricopeptide repeat protein [Bacteroidales bacterium]
MQKIVIFTVVILLTGSCGQSGSLDQHPAATDSVLYYLEQSRQQADSVADRAFAHAGRALLLARSKNPGSQVMFGLYVRLAVASHQIGNYELSDAYYRQALEFSSKVPPDTIAGIYNRIAEIALRQKKTDVAMEYYPKALQIRRERNDSEGIASSLLNIGTVYQAEGYYEQIEGNTNRAEKNYEHAENLYRESLDLYIILKNQQGQANCYNNLGSLARDRNQPEKALDYYRQSEKTYLQMNYAEGLVATYSNMGMTYQDISEINGAVKNNEALEYYRKALSTIAGYPVSPAIAVHSYFAVGMFFREIDQPDSAAFYYSKTIQTAEASKLLGALQMALRERSRLYAADGRYKEAYLDYVAYKNADDELLDKKKKQSFMQKSMQYEFDVKQQEQLYKNQLQKIFIIALSFVVLLIAFFAIAMKKMNRLLSRQQKDITDSIRCASLIQTATLPPCDYMKSVLRNPFFILYKPLNIVSGDFYWMTQKGEYTVVAAADCTGHGVPGAIVSMLGISMLDKIVTRMDTPRANNILNELRTEIIRLLNPEATASDTDNGMDIALTVIHHQEQEIEFSGANNPLYLVRNHQLLEYKANRMTVGLGERKDDPFTSVCIPYRSGDRVYLFSDGYKDQFGGAEGKKFLSQRFKELLVSLSDIPIAKQMTVLDEKHTEWKGNLPQVDDILIIGIEFS